MSANASPPTPIPSENNTPKVPAAAAVIRMVEAAKETPHERLMRKHLPAWVISGAVNVGMIALAILIFPRTVTPKPLGVVVATSVEKEEEERKEDLTNDDPGFQPDISSAAPDIQRVENQTVEAAVTQDNIGQPDAPNTDVTGLKVLGIASDAMAAPGVTGDAGTAFSGGAGDNGMLLASFPGRSGATKSLLLKSGGGNADSERAVAMGLAWLARQQRADGSWVFDGRSKNEVIAATGMALLPFLAAGETHKKGGRYQKQVAAGLAFLIKNLQISGPNAGRFLGASDMYGQAIGTVALCEAYGMTKDKGLLRDAAQAAINYIQAGQASNGSWGYQFGNAGDTSIVGWQIQALEAARLSRDLTVRDLVLAKANTFLDYVSTGSQKAAYGYTDNSDARPGTAKTAVGLLCRYYIAKWDPTHPGMAQGVTGLMKNPPRAGQMSDLYYYYYATQVVHFFEGDEWKTWNEGQKGEDGQRKGGMRDWLIGLQQRKEGANQGSWDAEAGFIGTQCGRLGTTAMSLLTLEVYYRHLPLYRRGNNKLNDIAK